MFQQLNGHKVLNQDNIHKHQYKKIIHDHFLLYHLNENYINIPVIIAPTKTILLYLL